MIGRVFDRKYRVERLLGKGGMGEVYEAVHVILDRKVALKVMHSELVSDQVATERFMREAMAASEIGHANIIDVQDVGVEDDGAVFIVMELLEGKTLEELLDKKGALHPALATRIILGVLTGLHAAHRKGIVHRDLKPENVVITADSQGRELVKLLDFGIAVFHKHKAGEEDLSLTGPGRVVGTPGYLSPEQIRGKKDIDGRVDVWAAGVMLYEILTGRLPFDGESYNEVLSQILLEEQVPMQQIVPRVPDQLVEIVDKALVKNRHDRYQSAGEFIGDLYLLQGPTSTPPDPVATISGSYSKVSTGDFEGRRSSPGSGSWTGNRRAVTADVEAIESREASERSHASGEMAAPDEGSQETTPMVWRDGSARPGRRLGAGFFASVGVTAVAVIGIAVMLIFFTDQEQPRPAPEPAAPPAPEPQAPEPEPEPVAPAEEEPAPDAEGQEAAPEMVTVTLEGLPPGATATLDGKQVEPEFQRPRSRTPYVLRVAAPGYEPFEKAVVLRRDLTVVVGMSKKAIGPSPTPQTSDGPVPGAPEQGEKPLVGNPFGG